MTVLDSLKESLEKRASLRVNQFGEYTPYDLKVIVALLVVNAGHADGNLTTDERIEMLKVLEKQFDFRDEEAAQVLEVAEFLWDKDKHLESFATDIQEQFEESQRVTLLAMYIQILESDGVVTMSEMSGIEDILKFLSLNRDSIDRAKEQLAGSPE